MIGKKDNHDIFNQYKSILLEQVEDEFSALINKIKTSSLDQASKDQLIKMVSAQKEHGMGDADAAGYASYPETMPVSDQDDEDTANEPDPEFAKDMAEAQKEQNKKYPEQNEEEGQYADPASFFAGSVGIKDLGPMKFDKQKAPVQSTPRPEDPSIFRKKLKPTPVKSSYGKMEDVASGWFGNKGDTASYGSSDKSKIAKSGDRPLTPKEKEFMRGFSGRG